MAEHFRCQGEAVHFSNGAVEQLYGALIRLAERAPGAPHAPAVAAFLRDALSGGGAGSRAFALDGDAADARPDGWWRCLARLLREFAGELRRERPDPALTDITWDAALRRSWRERVERLAALCDRPPAGGDHP